MSFRLEERSCSDRASVIDSTHETLTDSPISPRTGEVLHTAEIDFNERLGREMETE